MSGTIQNRKTYLQIQLGEIECLLNLQQTLVGPSEADNVISSLRLLQRFDRTARGVPGNSHGIVLGCPMTPLECFFDDCGFFGICAPKLVASAKCEPCPPRALPRSLRTHNCPPFPPVLPPRRTAPASLLAVLLWVDPQNLLVDRGGLCMRMAHRHRMVRRVDRRYV